MMDLNTQCAGCIMFSDAAPRDVIANLMHELSAENPEFNWIDLHMRDAGGRTLLSFRVDLRRSSEGFHTRFKHQIIGRLKRRLGTDEEDEPKGVNWWSMASMLESVT